MFFPFGTEVLSCVRQVRGQGNRASPVAQAAGTVIRNTDEGLGSGDH